jgi:hypothetical protein
MASNAVTAEWSRLPEPLPAASGMLVPLFRAATVYKLDPAQGTSRVMPSGSDHGYRKPTERKNGPLTNNQC